MNQSQSQNENSKEMARIAYEALDEKKGGDIRIIGLEGVSVIADYFIIASGENRNQVQAMTDNVQEMLERAGYRSKNIEGYRTASWILLDYGDIIVHVFSKEDRLFYDLERIWRDGRVVSVDEL